MPWQLTLLIVVAVFATAGFALVVLAIIQEREYRQIIWLEEAKRMHRIGRVADKVIYNGNFITANSKTRAEFEEWQRQWDEFGKQ